jgi:hypothetical protein
MKDEVGRTVRNADVWCQSVSFQPAPWKQATVAKGALAANHVNNDESSKGIIRHLLKAGAGILSDGCDINVEVCY